MIYPEVKNRAKHCLEARSRREPDLEEESVLADWAESVNALGLAADLRSLNETALLCGLSALMRLIIPGWSFVKSKEEEIHIGDAVFLKGGVRDRFGANYSGVGHVREIYPHNVFAVSFGMHLFHGTINLGRFEIEKVV